jgi:hypothetical protein
MDPAGQGAAEITVDEAGGRRWISPCATVSSTSNTTPDAYGHEYEDASDAKRVNVDPKRPGRSRVSGPDLPA